MFKKIINNLVEAINRKLGTYKKESNYSEFLSIDELEQSQYFNLWSLLPDRPTEGRFVILSFSGLSQISDSLNMNVNINGVIRQANAMEVALLRNLSATSPTEKCDALHIFYHESLPNNPDAYVCAIARQGGSNKIFTRTKDLNGIPVFAL